MATNKAATAEEASAINNRTNGIRINSEDHPKITMNLENNTKQEVIPMIIAQLSPASIKIASSGISPQTQADKNSSPVKAALTAQKSVQSAKTDTVTFSSQALQLSKGLKPLDKEGK